VVGWAGIKEQNGGPGQWQETPTIAGIPNEEFEIQQ